MLAEVLLRGMEKIKAVKMKMTQIWKDDIIVPVSPLRFIDGSQLDLFKEGDLVKVIGITKGKGFEGVVKRHGFHGGPKTHGQKNRLRAPGSIGSTAPQRVLPGRKMAGRMGGNRQSVFRLEVANINKEGGILMVKGSVPGNIGNKLEIIKI